MSFFDKEKFDEARESNLVVVEHLDRIRVWIAEDELELLAGVEEGVSEPVCVISKTEATDAEHLKRSFKYACREKILSLLQGWNQLDSLIDKHSSVGGSIELTVEEVVDFLSGKDE